MDFGSIIGFLVIAAISYIFNNNKETAKKSKSNRTSWDQRTTRKIDTGFNQPKRHTAQKSNSSKSNLNPFKGNLEDIFNELKGEFEKNFGNAENKTPYATSEKEVKKEDSIESKIDNIKDNKRSTKPFKSDLKDNTKSANNTVYSNEIGKEEIPIEFNRKSIIQGVIMSEVLQKPKSLRR